MKYDPIEGGIDDTMLKAGEILYPSEMKFNDHTMRAGGRRIGEIGQWLFYRWCKEQGLTIEDVSGKSYDYDFVVEGRHVEVKTKERSVPDRENYEASISDYYKQDTELYVFLTVVPSLKLYYIHGWASREYFEKHRFAKEKGSKDDNMKTERKEGAWNIYHKDLIPMAYFKGHLIDDEWMKAYKRREAEIERGEA